MKGRIVRAARTGDLVTLVVAVDEPDGTREYTGAVEVDRLARLGPADQRAALVEAVRYERDRQRARGMVDLGKLTGEVELVPAVVDAAPADRPVIEVTQGR